MDAEHGTMSTRRKLLGTAAGATGVAIATTVWPSPVAAASLPADGAARAAAVRSFVPGTFQIEIGGKVAGWVQSAEGGHATADVVNEKLGPDHIVHKHLAGVKYEDVTLQTGFGLEKTFFDWVSAMFASAATRKDGAIHSCDYDGNIVSTLDFFQGLISEVGFPALDASSKDAAYLTVKFAPEYTRRTPGTGKLQPPRPQPQKTFHPSNFRLEIDGLDCSKVEKIEGLTIKQKVVENPVGEQRDYQIEPASVEVPNLEVTLPESASQTWIDWHDDFVVKGNNGNDKERTGRLTILAPDLKTPLATIALNNIGVAFFKEVGGLGVEVEGQPLPEGGVGRRRFTRSLVFGLYCEQMLLAVGSATQPPPSPTPTPKPPNAP